jgi:hypothetical protein
MFADIVGTKIFDDEGLVFLLIIFDAHSHHYSFIIRTATTTKVSLLGLRHENHFKYFNSSSVSTVNLMPWPSVGASSR